MEMASRSNSSSTSRALTPRSPGRMRPVRWGAGVLFCVLCAASRGHPLYGYPHRPVDPDVVLGAERGLDVVGQVRNLVHPRVLDGDGAYSRIAGRPDEHVPLDDELL